MFQYLFLISCGAAGAAVVWLWDHRRDVGVRLARWVRLGLPRRNRRRERTLAPAPDCSPWGIRPWRL